MFPTSSIRPSTEHELCHVCRRPPAESRGESVMAMIERPRSVQSEACPIVQVVDQVAGKWSLSILIAATRAPVRYTELERTIPGISRRMLTATLRSLERDGLVTRTVYPTVPPKVEYSATESARELYTHLVALTDWAQRHRPSIIESRAQYDECSPDARDLSPGGTKDQPVT